MTLMQFVNNMNKEISSFENKWFFEEYYDAHLYVNNKLMMP